jgi:hypothetical protein
MTTSQQQVTAMTTIAVQGMVTVMTVSIFANALGMLAATSPVISTQAGVKASDAGIIDMRNAFGNALVDKAIKNVGRDDILTLAREVERLVVNEMNKQYGSVATTAALSAASPGDLRQARELAKLLSGHAGPVSGLSAGHKFETASVPEQVVAIQQTLKKPRVKRAAQPVKDTKTGIVYSSKAKAGMAVAAEYGLDSKNHFIWYEVIKKDPKRFVPALVSAVKD